MSTPTSAPRSFAAGGSAQPIIDWLAAVGERRDLSLAGPDDERAQALAGLLRVVAQEFSDYRDVVAGARQAARRNADHLAGVVRSTGETGTFVHATAAAAAVAGSGAAQMAQAADALCGFTAAAASAAQDASASLADIAGALDGLATSLARGNGPLAEMRTATSGVAGFLLTLARLSRHAQLLAVNASIEAAHLAEEGSRFGIVAEEVRKLSVSTRESKAGVAHIVAELRESTQHVAVAASESEQATAAARGEISGAGEALERTGRGIGEFGQLVATLADVAATQQMALEAIASSVTEIAHHADHAAGASRDAARLDIDTLLGRAEANAGRWTLRASSPLSVDEGSEFGRWIAAVAGGADPALVADIDADGELGALARAVRKLLAQVNAEQRDVLANVVEVAVAVSQNGYAWVAIGAALAGVRGEIATVGETAVEAGRAAQTSSEAAGKLQKLVEVMRGRYASALALLDGALTRTGRISTSVREIDGFVESMNGAATRADEIMALIETLSSETDLLSLNAAIEAAHAGELGQGFSVIAEEIRALARSTNDSTVSVSKLVADISVIGGNLQSSIGAAAASMSDVTGSAGNVRAALTLLHSSFESAIERAQDVAVTASEQARALDGVLENIKRSRTALDADPTATTDQSRTELAVLGSRAHAIAARRPLGTVVSRVRDLAETLCTRLEATLEAALSGRRVTLDQLCTLTYEPLEGAAIAGLRRLFDVSRVPAAGFRPAKYATPWDAFVDGAMIDVLTQGWDEATAAALSPVTIFVSDLNGFFYAYPRQKIAAWTNDPGIDGAGNRIKRLFEDEYALRVGRHGLGPQAAQLGPRQSYDSLRAAGCELDRIAPRPWGAFVYARDTSLVCNEVAMAIYVRGMRHSTLRVCYDPKLI